MKKNNFSYERIIEIITLVLKELHAGQMLGEVNVEALLQKGYSNSEISAAVSWIADKLEVSREFFVHFASRQLQAPGNFRILHEAEKQLFTNDGWGQVIELQQLGILTSEISEELIEQGMMSGAKELTANDIRNFVAHRLFQAGLNQGSGNRILLDGSESVN